jgi:LysM repeat protein
MPTQSNRRQRYRYIFGTRSLEIRIASLSNIYEFKPGEIMKKNNVLVIAIVAIVVVAGVSIFAIANNNDGMMNDNMMGNNKSSQQAANSLVDKNSADYKMYSELIGEDYPN